VADQTGASHHTVKAVRAKAEGRGQIAHVDKRTDSQGRAQPAKKGKPAKPTVTTGGVVFSEACKERIQQQTASLLDKWNPTSPATDAEDSANARKAAYAADEEPNSAEAEWLSDLMAYASDAAAGAYLRKEDCVGFKVTRQALALARDAATSWATTLAFLETLPVMDD
jgi:hypothetical protein